jgi:thiamine-phosphate pyrophosphorylase
VKSKKEIDYSLYLVTDRHLAGLRGIRAIVRSALIGGATVVQFREKELNGEKLLAEAIALKKICDEYNVPFIVNDRLDLAIACSADGIHIGQDDIPIASARKALGDKKIIGVSVSTPGEAEIAQSNGADYIGISPVWATPTKTDTPNKVGINGISEIRKIVTIPCVGIGGIKKENAKSVITAGCDGIAVVSAIFSSKNPEESAKGLLRIVREAKGKL